MTKNQDFVTQLKNSNHRSVKMTILRIDVKKGIRQRMLILLVPSTIWLWLQVLYPLRHTASLSWYFINGHLLYTITCTQQLYGHTAALSNFSKICMDKL